jgi:6-pyruvoyltetrahydropterin/6-carboxytetrahydropterin synthase
LRNTGAGNEFSAGERGEGLFWAARYLLSASHRLHSDALSAEENRAAYGKCNNPHGHGHNYVVEVLVGGEVDPETGMVVNLAALDEVVRKNVIERFDHANLNLDPCFKIVCRPRRICVG